MVRMVQVEDEGSVAGVILRVLKILLRLILVRAQGLPSKNHLNWMYSSSPYYDYDYSEYSD